VPQVLIVSLNAQNVQASLFCHKQFIVNGLLLIQLIHKRLLQFQKFISKLHLWQWMAWHAKNVLNVFLNIFLLFSDFTL